jgi:hypothetical protein
MIEGNEHYGVRARACVCVGFGVYMYIQKIYISFNFVALIITQLFYN